MPAHLIGLSVSTLMGALGVALSVAFTVPQLRRLRRDGSPAGVSLTGLANSTVSLAAWTAYGVVHARGWVVASSVVAGPATLATLVLGVRAGAPRARLAVPALWGGLLAGVACLDVLTGRRLLDVALGLSIAWLVVPAAVAAWRSTDVSGIAASTWWVLAAEGVVFGVYGSTGHVYADAVYGVAALAGAAVVLTRLALPAAVVARWSATVPPDRVELAA